MSSRDEDRPRLVSQPDMDHARETAGMAHSVVIALKELGLPGRFDGELASLSTDLGDIWGAQADFNNRLEDLLRDAGDWRRVGDALVDVKSAVDHMAWHLESVRTPLVKLARYAYGQNGAEEAAGK